MKICNALGIDFGTSGTRACVIDSSGEILAESRSTSPSFSRPRAGWSEQAPEIWWRGLVECLKGLPAAQREGVTDLAIDATSASICLSDDHGQSLGPALMYNDARATAEAEQIHTVAPADTAARGASSSLAKALWLSKAADQPGARVLHQADWINEKLGCPPGVTDYNNALKLGYDPVKRLWPTWISTLTQLQLPDVVSPGSFLATISPDAARALGLPEHVRIHAGTTDSTAAFIATGACHAGDAVTSIGSTLVMKLLATSPVFAPEYGVYSHRFGDLWLVGGASNTGGQVLLNWFTPEEISLLSAQIDSDQPTGLSYYPLLEPGERFPFNDPTYPPHIEPVPDDRARFLQGLFEGIAAIEKLSYERLDKLGCPRPEQIFTVGGGATNPQWTKIRRQLMDCKVTTPVHQEAAYGAARLAGGLCAPFSGS